MVRRNKKDTATTKITTNPSIPTTTKNPHTKKNAPPKAKNTLKPLKFHPIGRKTTKIININNFITTNKQSKLSKTTSESQTDPKIKYPTRTLGLQTPAIGVGLKNRAVNVTTFSSSGLSGIEIFTAEQNQESGPKKFDGDLAKSYEIFNVEVWESFCTLVGELMEDMVLVDSHEESIEKIKKLVGPKHLVSRSHFEDALLDCCSFEFMIWCRFLESEQRKPKTDRLHHLGDFDLTVKFMDRFFGPEHPYC